MSLLDDVLASAPCSIELPAGTGKTETIATLAHQSSELGRRILLLTHTHAGVDALRRRLKKKGIASSTYTIRTLDSWCFDLIGSFPLLSEIEVGEEPDWAQTASYHMAGVRAVNSMAVRRMLAVSYDLLVVDEYQDCQLWQHELVVGIADQIPTVVLGDRMQGLFFFGEASQPVLWERDVLPRFSDLPQPIHAWRWQADNPELGEWLLHARRCLFEGRAVSLGSGPLTVISPDQLQATARDLPRHPERSVVIKRWPSDCAVLSAQLGAGFTMIEELEGKHLLSFAASIDRGGSSLADATVCFAISCAFGVAPVFGANRRQSLLQSEPAPLDLAAFPEHTQQVLAINNLLRVQSRQSVLEALQEIRNLPGFRPHRREAWFGMLDAIRLACASPDLSVRDCVVAIRNQLRIRGRFPESRIIARPLLIKGLEFDHAIVAETIGLNAHELYVCLTRGSKSLVVVSQFDVLNPQRPTESD